MSTPGIGFELIGKKAIGGYGWPTVNHTKGTVAAVLPGGILCSTWGGYPSRKRFVFYSWEEINGWEFMDQVVWEKIVDEEEARRKKPRPEWTGTWPRKIEQPTDETS